MNKYLEKLANCCFLQFLCSSFAFLRVSSLPTLNWSLALCQGCVLGAEGLMGWGGGVCEADGPAESQSCPAGCGTEACARSLCDPAHSGCPWQQEQGLWACASLCCVAHLMMSLCVAFQCVDESVPCDKQSFCLDTGQGSGLPAVSPGDKGLSIGSKCLTGGHQSPSAGVRKSREQRLVCP